MIPAGAWCLVPGAWCLVPGAWCLPGTIRFMPVDIDITKVARLARIGLTAEELAAYSTQLQGILNTPLGCRPFPAKVWLRRRIHCRW